MSSWGTHKTHLLRIHELALSRQLEQNMHKVTKPIRSGSHKVEILSKNIYSLIVKSTWGNAGWGFKHQRIFYLVQIKATVLLSTCLSNCICLSPLWVWSICLEWPRSREIPRSSTEAHFGMMAQAWVAMYFTLGGSCLLSSHWKLPAYPTGDMGALNQKIVHMYIHRSMQWNWSL